MSTVTLIFSCTCSLALAPLGPPPPPPCSDVTFHSSLDTWTLACTDPTLRVTFEEPFWPVNQWLAGAWNLNGVTFQGFAGAPVGNIYIADFGAPFGSPQWLTANGDEDIDITPDSPVTAIAFDATSNQFGQATVTVYDLGGTQIGVLEIPVETVRFVGITAGVPISRINFRSTLGAIQNTGFDNVRIASFVPIAASPDIDGDGHVNGSDLGLLLGNWNGAGAGDLNCDGTVDGADLGVLLGGWNS